MNPGFVNPAFGNNGFANGFGNQPGFYGPANYNPGYAGFGGNFGNFGPGFNYAPFPNTVPQYQPTAPFGGFQAQFAPQPLLTPQEFNQQLSQYLSSLQQQYARYIHFKFNKNKNNVKADCVSKDKPFNFALICWCSLIDYSVKQNRKQSCVV